MNIPSSKNWNMVKLGDVAEITSSKRIFANEYLLQGVPFYRGKEIIEKQKGEDVSTELYISKEKFDEIKNKFGIQKTGDILLTSVGTLGVPYVVDEKDYFYFKDGNLTWFRNYKNIIPKFLYYWMLSPAGKESLGHAVIGSTQQAYTITQLNRCSILLPQSLEEQKEIVDMFGSLDDKIELLRKENKTLENIAQTLFKEWFVDFNFPGSTGKMVDSDFGEIPEGWKAGTLRDICINFDSKRIPLASDVRAKRKGIYPYYGATQIMDFIDEFLFDGTYLLLAEDASVMDEKGFPVLQYVEGKFWVSNHAHVLQGKDEYSTEMLTLLMRQTPVAGIVTGAVQLKINQENLFSLVVVVPPKEVGSVFNQTIQPLFKKLKNNEKEIQTLSKLRDQLLNKIFSN